MKKILVTFLVFLLCFSVCACSAPEQTFERPSGSLDFSGQSGTVNPGSGSQSGTQKPSPSLPLLNVSDTEDGVVYNMQFYAYSLSITKQDGKLIQRNRATTNLTPVSEASEKPANASDFVYISPNMPKSVYTIPYAYGVAKKSSAANNNAFNINDNNAQAASETLFNFIRYVYIQTDTKVIISIDFDTSFNYQTSDAGGGMVIRAKITANEFSDVPVSNFTELMNMPIGQKTLLSIFHDACIPIDLKIISEDNSISAGASVWCDIVVGIGLLNDNDRIWKLMLLDDFAQY